jgi:hypothetical protein
MRLPNPVLRATAAFLCAALALAVFSCAPSDGGDIFGYTRDLTSFYASFDFGNGFVCSADATVSPDAFTLVFGAPETLRGVVLTLPRAEGAPTLYCEGLLSPIPLPAAGARELRAVFTAFSLTEEDLADVSAVEGGGFAAVCKSATGPVTLAFDASGALRSVSAAGVRMDIRQPGG